MSAPGYARLGTGRPGCGSVDFAGSVRGGFWDTSGFSVILFAWARSSYETNPALLHLHYNTPAALDKVIAESLKERQLDIQEFLRILPEIPDQEPHISG